MIGRPDCLYYDSLGQDLEPARTVDDRIELTLTGEQIDVGLLNEVVQHGFSALSAEAAAQAAAGTTSLSQASQEGSKLFKDWPLLHSVDHALRPVDRELQFTDFSKEVVSRFLAPSLHSGDPFYRGSFFHNAWHIAKGICLNCPH
jgi:hypothetical protein